MSKKDYYAILGVSPSATAQEIKKAYRKKVLELHPDQHKGDKAIEEKFKQVTNAYDVLGNPEKRANYDRFGDQGVGAAGFSQSKMNDINEILRNFGMDFGGRQQTYQKKGEDLRVTLALSLEEIAKGVKRKIKIKRYDTCKSCTGNGAHQGTAIETCSACNGSGVINRSQRGFMQIFFNTACDSCQGQGKKIKHHCTRCHGQGREKIEDVIDLNLPPGTREGVVYLSPGKGNVPIRGGGPGDLRIIIREEPYKLFRREENDIHYHYPITFPDAALGTKMHIPTLHGPVKVTVPPHTQSETILRLRNKGIPNMDTGAHGDQIVHLHITMPKKLSKEETSLIKKLKEHKAFQSKED